MVSSLRGAKPAWKYISSHFDDSCIQESSKCDENQGRIQRGGQGACPPIVD